MGLWSIPTGKRRVQRKRAQRLRASQAKPGALRREQDVPPEMSRLTPDPLHAVTGRLRHQVSQANEDENAGVDAALSGEQAAETLLQAGESAYRRVKTPGRAKPVPQRTEKAVPHGLQPGQAMQSDTSSLAMPGRSAPSAGPTQGLGMDTMRPVLRPPARRRLSAKRRLRAVPRPLYAVKSAACFCWQPWGHAAVCYERPVRLRCPWGKP